MWRMVCENFYFLQNKYKKWINAKFNTSLDDVGEWGTISDNMTGDGVLGAVVERRADIGISALYLW